MGNISTWTQQYEATTRAYDFTYDAADQLAAAVYRTTDPTPTTLKRYGYAYDPVGNRTTEQIDDAPRTWAYDSMNRLSTQAGGGSLAFAGTVSEPATVTVQSKPASVTGSNSFLGTATVGLGTNTVQITAMDATGNSSSASYEVDVESASETFTYDANGNLTAQGTRTYEWDAANRLVRILNGPTELSRFAYDGWGRRVQKSTGTTVRTYVYDREDVLQEQADTIVVRRHVHGPDVDQPLATIQSGTTKYLLADHLGSVIQTTSDAAAVIENRHYDLYGQFIESATIDTYAFTGREWDAEVELYYVRNRYYDPSRARFLSEDPIKFKGGHNFYRYVENNPIINADPFGFDTWRVNRRLGGKDPRSRSNPATHTYIVTTNSDGSVKNTYSWGNVRNEYGWNLDQPEDIEAAKTALKGKMAEDVAGTDLDPYIERAYQDLSRSNLEHPNGLIVQNCKTESDKLINAARFYRAVKR